ncbi:hypothetical protein E3P94_02149 [Wallemia ichthyophaga]|nr:hypothetical protein E3P95_02025 [Wallemia ichthyophaga]TIB00553.1 hypothetical protein E3P94_02149 [Wallemia ichthyophaga]
MDKKQLNVPNEKSKKSRQPNTSNHRRNPQRNSSTYHDDDLLMAEADAAAEARNDVPNLDNSPQHHNQQHNDHDLDLDQDLDHDDDDDNHLDEIPQDDHALLADYRMLSGLIFGQSSRYKNILQHLRERPHPLGSGDGTQLMIALQELAEVLAVSTEETLAGSFQVEAFSKELIAIMNGDPPTTTDQSNKKEPLSAEAQEEAEIMAALAASGGGGFGDNVGEAQLLACRCLANLMEALPGSSIRVAQNGAIPILCSKLRDVQYVDLAEEAVSTLGKLAQEVPNKIVSEGGLTAILQYLDFFNSHVQRTALTAAANCCRALPPDSFDMVHDAIPKIRDVLGYSDQRLVEQACLCVVRIIDSYKNKADLIEKLLEDGTLITAVVSLLLPSGSGGTPLITINTFTALLRSMSSASKASAKAAIALLDGSIVDTLYNILTGVLVPEKTDPTTQAMKDGSAPGEGGLADMVVLENLAHRPKDQVDEALSLSLELLPPIVPVGVFDNKSYVNKTGEGQDESSRANEEVESHAPPSLVNRTKQREATRQEAMRNRIECLRSNPASIDRFMSLMLPVFVEVFAASVSLPVRSKALAGLLKIVSFAEEPELQNLLRFIPMASFIGGILSSRDNPNLVTGALQLVELLVNKLPEVYHSALRRQGVMYEIEVIADDKLNSEKDDKEKQTEPNSTAERDEGPLGGDPVSNLARALRVDIPQAESSPGFLSLGTGNPANRLASYLAAGSAAASAAAGTASPASLDRASNVNPSDAAIARARALKEIFAKLEEQNGAETYDDAKVALAEIREMVQGLKSSTTPAEQIEETLQKLGNWFTREDSMSSFELLRSGLIEGLLAFITGNTDSLPTALRHKLVIEIFSSRRSHIPGSPSALLSLVKRLQESLSRLEPFSVSTVGSNLGDDSRRSPISALSRQVRLRLVADDPELSKVQPTMVVSVHAIATFQILNDYLRPRIMNGLSGKGGSGSSRLSGVLAAFAAATGIPPPEADASSPNSSKKENKDKKEGSSKSSSRRSSKEDLSGTPTASNQESKSKGKGKESAQGDEDDEDNYEDDEDDIDEEELRAMEEDDDEHEDDEDENDRNDPFAGEFVDEFDDELYDDEMEADMVGEGRLGQEKTINLDVKDDGKEIEAKTPEGTRIPSPAVASEASPSARKSSKSSSKKPESSEGTKEAKPKGSYASALKTKPTDFHLEFELNGEKVDLGSTIYSNLHDNDDAGSRNVFANVYTLKFRRKEGPVPKKEKNDVKPNISAITSESVQNTWSQLPASVAQDSQHALILQLLRVLHAMCTGVQEVNVLNQPGAALSQETGVGEMTFVNNKLTAKLNRQLEEPMLIASSCLPDWAIDLPTAFPFLFTFQTRYAFLQAQSWGTARLITKWQNEASRTSSDSRRIDPTTSHLGRMQRQKVRISREYVLESAIKVFELYGGSSSILEIEYFEEVGTGLGPTLEFYSLVSKEFARKDLKLWRGSSDSSESPYVYSQTGLFPMPMSAKEIESDRGEERIKLFRILGQFLAKGLLDSRIIDISFNPLLMNLVMGLNIPKSVAGVKLVDPLVGKSIEEVQKIVGSTELSKGQIADKIDNLALDFTLPGQPEYQLVEKGENVDVTLDNVGDFIDKVIDATLVSGVTKQVDAFVEGFSKILSVEDMKIFTPEELTSLFGNADEDWTTETLSEVIKADHGFNNDSPALRRLIEALSEFDKVARRDFLQFLTGSPKLPIGGFRGLHPQLTVVRKSPEAGYKADDSLPSVMTCANYLKLPDYSDKDVLKQKLTIAMSEGKAYLDSILASMNFKFLHCNFKFDVVNFFTLKPFKINFNNFSIYLNLHTVPILCIIVLLASRCIGGEQLKYGFVGDETHLRPYDILLLFLSLAYIALSLDATGLLQYLAFWVSNKGKNSGYALYAYFYCFFIFLATFVGNDPVILSGTAFLAYFTRVTGLHPPIAFLFSQFTAANLASAVLPPSNPTNLVLTSTTSTSFLTYALYLILPVFFSAIALLGVLFIQFSPYNKLLSRDDNEVYIPSRLSAPEVNPRSVLIDRTGAIFSSVILTATLVSLVICSVLIEGMHVCWITIPAAFVVFVRDLVHDWRHHAKFKSKVEKRIGWLRTVNLSFPTVLTVGSRLPFALIPFAITQFILVNSLQAVGWIDIFASWAQKAIGDDTLRAVWVLGLIEIVLCNGSTNIGATVLMSQVLVQSSRNPKTIKRVIEENSNLRKEIEILKNNFANYPNANELKNLAVLVRDTLQEFDSRERLMRRRILVLQHQRDQLNYQVEGTSSNHSHTQQLKVFEENSDNDIEVLRNLLKSKDAHKNADPLWFKRVRKELDQVTDTEEEKALDDIDNRRDTLKMKDRDRQTESVLDDYMNHSASPSYSQEGYPQRPPARMSMRGFDDDDNYSSQFNLPNNTTTRTADLEAAYKRVTEAFEKLADENIRNSVAVHQILKEYRQTNGQS